MPEPITIGALAASALAMAADAAINGAIGTAAKDAYTSLKAAIARWSGSDVELLEREPASTARRGVIAEIVDRQSANDQTAVQALTEKLVKCLEDLGAGNPAAVGRSVTINGNVTGNVAAGDYHDYRQDRSVHAGGNVYLGPSGSRPSDGG